MLSLRTSLVVCLFVVAVGAWAPSSAHASNSSLSKVVWVSVYTENSYATVTLDTSRTASCGSQPSAFAFKINTDSGKAILSALLAAKVSGGSVYLFGTGACPTDTAPSGISTIELLSSVQTGP